MKFEYPALLVQFYEIHVKLNLNCEQAPLPAHFHFPWILPANRNLCHLLRMQINGKIEKGFSRLVFRPLATRLFLSFYLLSSKLKLSISIFKNALVFCVVGYNGKLSYGLSRRLDKKKKQKILQYY